MLERPLEEHFNKNCQEQKVLWNTEQHFDTHQFAKTETDDSSSSDGDNSEDVSVIVQQITNNRSCNNISSNSKHTADFSTPRLSEV